MVDPAGNNTNFEVLGGTDGLDDLAFMTLM